MADFKITKENFPALFEATKKKFENKQILSLSRSWETPVLNSGHGGFSGIKTDVLDKAMLVNKQNDIRSLQIPTVGRAHEPAAANPAVDAVEMSGVEPLFLETKKNMGEADYNACSIIMSACQNMAQKTIKNAARKRTIPESEALKNMNAWIYAFVDFPLPVFNFKDRQSDTYTKDHFLLNADISFIANIVNIRDVIELQNAVLDAVRKFSQKNSLINYSKSARDFNYFGVITNYYEREISFRVITFAMHMKDTDVNALCGGTQKTKLDSSYDTYQFTADKNMMIEMQKKIGADKPLIFANALTEFLKTNFPEQMEEYEENIMKVL